MKGFVYFVEAPLSRKIKIGYTSNLDLRMRQLQTGNHERLRLRHAKPGTMEDEAALHKRFAHLRGQGEWFRLSDELENYIQAHFRKPEIPETAIEFAVRELRAACKRAEDRDDREEALRLTAAIIEVRRLQWQEGPGSK